MNPPPAVLMTQITRGFGRVLANDQVSLEVARGEVHAVVGENGAGKSTLMKILYGLYRPDAGSISVDGRKVEFRSPAEAIASGIGMVHQHFMLIPPFTVTENIVLGCENTRHGFLELDKAAEQVASLASRFHLPVEPKAEVGALSVGQQQRVEILKILYRDARIIILDEPTAVLTPQEVDQLFSTIDQLRASGRTIIIITHKLREVMALSDRLTVLRDGRNVATLKTSETSPEEIARLMVGRDVVLPTLAQEIGRLEPKSAQPGAAPEEIATPPTPVAAPPSAQEPLLRVSGLNLGAKGARALLSDLSFEIAPGEILGVAGVEGNGQSELVEVLTGLRRASSGCIEIRGKDVTRLSPRAKFRSGLACIPEDRQRKGLVMDFTLRENLLLGRHREWGFARRLTRSRAKQLLEDFDVRPADPSLRVSALSGGNQQKVIVAREFTRGAAVLIVAQPTRGIDLGAIEFIHRKLLELRANGCGVLLVSAELSEILALSDRVVVMYGGRIVFSARNQGLNEHDLGVYMTGTGGETLETQDA